MKRLALAALFGAIVAAPADAIPAFARKYGVPCSMCHDPIPNLNPYGMRFAAMGYVMSDEDTVGTNSHGDPLLRLNDALPIAIRFDAYVRASGGRSVRWDFQTPTIAKLLSGGQIARGVSYYLYLLLAEDGKTGPIEDAWLLFRKPAGIPADITIGQFQIIDPVWKRELRITLEDYSILGFRAGASAANLTYDRGIMVGAAPTATTAIYGAVTNGNGIEEAVDGQFDGDAPKAGTLMMTQTLGPLTVGGVGYYGRQLVIPTGQTASVTNLTRMIGPSAVLQLGSMDFSAQYLYRDDSDPDFTGTTALTTTRGGFAEAKWWPQGHGNRTLVTGLYNIIDTSAPGADYESATLNLSYLFARNVRVAVEYTRDMVGNSNAVGLGVVTAF
jgi:hypothetical protein